MTSSQNPGATPVIRDQPLPSEVAVRSDTWLNRARNYPVFSRTWLYYRILAWSIPIGIILVIVTLISLSLGATLNKVGAILLPLWSGLSVLHLLGPALAVFLRQRRYPERRETPLLVGALLFGALCAYGTFEAVNYGTKVLLLQGPHTKLTLNATAKVSDDDVAEDGKPEANKEAAKKEAAPAGEAGKKDKADKTDKSEVSDFDHKLASRIADGFTFMFLFSGALYIAGGYDFWLFLRQKKRLKEALQQRELQQAQDAQREAELRLSVLAAQVEPHFLFNTLAGARSAILTEPQRATDIIDHLVEYLRATIPEFRNDVRCAQARLSKQLAAVQAYLSLMQARIPRLSFDVVTETEDALVPPLMLISLVENAIKHGVEPKIGPVHVRVQASVHGAGREKKLELSVEDDGVGFSGSSSGSGIGLSNIHARLASMYGERAGLLLKSRPGGGVIAMIWLPFENEK